MRKFVTFAFIGMFAVSVASCGSQGSNSASNLEVDSLVGPSALEARSGQGGGKGGGGNGGGGSTGGGGGSLSLVPVADNGTPGLSFLDKITFNVSTTATPYPWVSVKCYQNGALVFQQANAMFDLSLMKIFTLGPSPNWQGGAANCTATLENRDAYYKNGSITPLTSISFDVTG